MVAWAYRAAMRSLPAPGFSGDAGSSDPALANALAAYDSDPADGPVLVALSRTRLLVPVVALAGNAKSGTPTATRQTTLGQARSEKSADVAAVLWQRSDGRRALLAFSCLASMQAWDPSARPVPTAASDAAAAALAQDADALLLDRAGPVMYVVETSALRHLAAGRRMASTSAGYVWLEAP